MSSAVKIGLGTFIGLIIIVIGIGAYVISAKFTAERFEQAIVAQDEQMQNVWGMMEGSLKMSGFTVEKYGKDFIDSIKANAIRYENDQGSMMKWVKESQSQLSSEAYTKFQDLIEKAYLKKEMAQTSKISISQEYRTFINASIKGTISKLIFNYPTEKATTIMDRVISTSETKETWAKGIEEVKNPFETK